MKKVEDIFIKSFAFLSEMGYDSTTVIGKQHDYDIGVVMENKHIAQRITFAYYINNPLSKNSSSECAISIRLFTKNGHLDFSRLFKSASRLSVYAKYQYFILDRKDIEDFLSVCSTEIRTNCMGLLLGSEWIQLDYDLRDDY